MDHKQSAILKTHMKMENFLVNELTITDERLCASLSNTPAVFATAGCAEGSISKSIRNEEKKQSFQLIYVKKIIMLKFSNEKRK